MHRSVQLSSQQHLNINFNPASLLSIGDALAFAGLLTGTQTARGDSESGSVSDFIAASPENAPQMHEQMASTQGITSRVPQKYLIQNQSGLTTFYWGAEVQKLGSCTLGSNRINGTHAVRHALNALGAECDAHACVHLTLASCLRSDCRSARGPEGRGDVTRVSV